MKATLRTIVWTACLAGLLLAAQPLKAQNRSFDGAWKMDVARSQVNDGRVVNVTIVTGDETLKMVLKTTAKDGANKVSEFTAKLNGKACEFQEGSHTSNLTVWYDKETLNICKENGPADDQTSIWKLEVSPDKQTLTMKITHYEPSAADERLVFTKQPS